MNKDITVYTSDNCAYCVMVKKYLTVKGRNFKEVNIDQDAASRDHIQSLTGARTVPVTVVVDDEGNREFTVGYNLPQLSAAIA